MCELGWANSVVSPATPAVQGALGCLPCNEYDHDHGDDYGFGFDFGFDRDSTADQSGYRLGLGRVNY
ncbi:hypothetical protein J7T55_008732 [Diaporthe amygdali]|uniref:uncharacterized protein n=1 Tax=Phomopsis amygdali TaxID=1214568 RepID=UPI0022FE655F|nr:uncharacterized protein J7T55_008732 [Diaporthe amygdali]KAJ0121568.1 hypothetical protein J7T55_008732 [Diaporthe amygdali]